MEKIGEQTRSGSELTVIESGIGDESSGSRTLQVGVSGSGGVADALQVVMPEGRTPGRHDGRDAEVRRFSPFPFRRHPSSCDDTSVSNLLGNSLPSLLFS